mmetsp:Transcript_40528/g.130289  ORF Transcript_40528/g.130289 Transcript_40528/m.130289 type:complete len:407 (-) Transcript_40528:116-1336(-)
MTRDAADPDARHARGMHAEGDDWSKLPNSQRKDRPLSSAQLKELAAKSNGRGFVALAGNCSLILATGGAIMLTDGVLVPALWRQAWPPLLLLLLLLWQGFLLSALGFAAQHECLHYTAFRTKSLNSLVGRLVSVPSFAFFLHEQAMHKEHHTYTQDLERDPELVAEVAGCTYSGAASGLPDGVDLAAVAAAGRNGFKKVPLSRAQYFERFTCLSGYTSSKLKKFWHCGRGVPVDYSSDGWLLKHCPPGARLTASLQYEARVQAGGTLALLLLWLAALGWRSLLLTWLLPAYLGPPLLYFVQMHEHAACALDPDGLSNTRTTLTSPLLNFVMWNMSYHAEHHLYTILPFHALPRAHALLKQNLVNLSEGGHLSVHRQVLGSWIREQHDAIVKAAKSGAVGKENEKSD